MVFHSHWAIKWVFNEVLLTPWCHVVVYFESKMSQCSKRFFTGGSLWFS